MKIKNISNNPYFASNIERLLPDTFVAHVAYNNGRTCMVSLQQVLEVYSRFLSGRLSNSSEEIEFIKGNGKPSETYEIKEG